VLHLTLFSPLVTDLPTGFY